MRNNHLLLLLGLMLASPATASAQRRMAITIDDVPWVGGGESNAVRTAMTSQMITALRRHNAPVAVFVVCGRIGDAALLKQWIHAGATIGNHSARHRNLNEAPLPEWLNDVRSCDRDLRTMTGHPVKFFRFPMLHEGKNAEQANAAASLLRELGYRNGHVTVDNSDFVLMQPYSVALTRGDTARARRIAGRALTHDLAATRHFEDVAQSKVRRAIPQIILLHANAMTAALLPPLLDSLAQRGYQFVSLEEALRDPVFGKRTCYTGEKGLSFLYRIAPCTPGQDAWDTAESTRLTNPTATR